MEIITGQKFLKILQNQQSAILADPQTNSAVRLIIEDVIQNGDQALHRLTKKFDGIEVQSLKVPIAEITRAGKELDPTVTSLLQESIQNVKNFHEKQAVKSWDFTLDNGSRLGQIVNPLDRVGVYVPGGRALYPSTLIMNVVPAQIAGVPSIAVVSPPGKNGLPDDLVLATCDLLGLDEVYAVGGAQSVAALAFGTETIAQVCKIVGPGNQYVAEAKRQVFGQVGIESVAGPSEILILHDQLDVPVEFIVRDLISQAEHDPEAQSILVTTDQDLPFKVEQRLQELIPTLPRTEIITPSLTKKGFLIAVDNLEEGIEIVNRVAPEHLEVLVEDESCLNQIRNAGAIFLGQWSSEPVGDYWAGPNHVLPTSGTAKFASPLGVYDFVKYTSLIQYTQKHIQNDGHKIAQLADLESLNGHAEAIRVRLNHKK